MMPPLDIAVVDDDPVTREVLAAIFRNQGCQVHTFASGYEFLKAATSPPDCLLLDVYMPGLSGLDVLALIGGSRYPAPIIMISGHSDIPTAVAAIEAGAHDFIEKPFTGDELIDRVCQVVGEFRKPADGKPHPGRAK